MEELLAEFVVNGRMRNAVQSYIDAYLEQRAVTLVFQGDPPTGLKEAQENLHAAFDTLVEQFTPKEKPKEIINQSL